MASTGSTRATGANRERYQEVLTPAALEFLAELQGQFGGRREELLAARADRRRELARSGRLDFLPSTRGPREDQSWRVADVATADISRSQIWQWCHEGTALAGGRGTVTADLVRRVVEEELGTLKQEVGDEAFATGRYEQARELFEEVALADEFPDFLTVPGYQLLGPGPGE